MRIRWRGFELPTQVVCDPETRTDSYARFVVEPFERGFGATVGNSMRRILLSSLEGAAVTAVKIDGAQHEFSALPGVYEDVAAIMLNLKQLKIKIRNDEPALLTVTADGKRDVTAADIDCGPNVEIINPDLVIATLTEDKAAFKAEIEVKKGRGYLTADENSSHDRDIGWITLDSLFSPVVKVNYRAEDTRVGQRTNYDRLIIEIWTDGTVSPGMALVESGKILQKHVVPFTQYSELGDEIEAGPERAGGTSELYVDEELEKKASIPLADLGLSARALHCLTGQQINSVGDLIALSEKELLGFRNFGQTSLNEVKELLGKLGLSLGMGDEGDEAETTEEPMEEPEQNDENEAEEKEEA
jgi:DNA-directed RNA polymerase subunit alpha